MSPSSKQHFVDSETLRTNFNNLLGYTFILLNLVTGITGFLLGLTWSQLSLNMRIFGSLILVFQLLFNPIVVKTALENKTKMMEFAVKVVFTFSVFAFFFIPFLLYTYLTGQKSVGFSF